MPDEKYKLQMEGPQIDDALLQMHLRQPEKWTQGTRDGIPVDSGDETYHNNAKWFAQQAANAAQRAESAVPAGTDSAVLFNRDQSGELTTLQKAMARKNIMAGGSNRNLLDNPWFSVNQRGQTSYTGTGFTVDRWYSTANSSIVTVADGYVSLNMAAGSLLRQRVPAERLSIGENYMISLMTPNGEIYATRIVTTAGERAAVLGTINGVEIMCEIDGRQNSAQWGIYIYARTAWAISVKAIKVEKGTVSTLANDTPPDYLSELAKCQYYFVRVKADQGYAPFGVGYIETASAAHVFVPINMRSKPASAVVRGAFRLMGSANRTGITIAYSQNSSSRLARLDVTGGTGWPAGQACTLSADNDANAYIDFSADF